MWAYTLQIDRILMWIYFLIVWKQRLVALILLSWSFFYYEGNSSVVKCTAVKHKQLHGESLARG